MVVPRTVLHPLDILGRRSQFSWDLYRNLIRKFEGDNLSEATIESRIETAKSVIRYVVSSMKDCMDRKEKGASLRPWNKVPTIDRQVGYEMLEDKMLSEGIPLKACAGFWGARLMLSKHWMNVYERTEPRSSNVPVIDLDFSSKSLRFRML